MSLSENTQLFLRSIFQMLAEVLLIATQWAWTCDIYVKVTQMLTLM